jgi:hypothetical protein
MAYADPSKLRDKEIRLRLNEREFNLVRAMVDYTGEQMGPLLREILLSGAERVIGGQMDIALEDSGTKDTFEERSQAA